jgi:hypothetical protein
MIVVAVHPDLAGSLQEMLYFGALEQGWLAQDVKIVPVFGPCGAVSVPVSVKGATEKDPATLEQETIEFTGLLMQVTDRGTQRAVRIGFGPRSKLIIFQALPWTVIPRKQQLNTNA